MLKRCMLAVTSLILFSCSGPPTPESVIANASRAMGADGLNTIQYSGSGREHSFAQAYNATSGWPGFPTESYSRTVNYQTPSWRVERIAGEAEANRKGGGNPPRANQIVVVDENTPWPQLADFWLLPHGFLKTAATMSATLQSETLDGRTLNVVSFTAAGRPQVSGYINDENLVEKVETWVDSALTGDTLLEATYTNYQDFDGVQFPTRIVVNMGGNPIQDLTITDVSPNVAADIQPAEERGGQGGEGETAPAARSIRLGDGVYAILPAYAALAVEFDDHIVVFEGPQSEVRGNAIITEVKRVIPDKPIRYLVNSHWHADHSSGLRAFVAEGATILTHPINKPWLEQVLNTPHTLNPDRQEQVQNPVIVEEIPEKMVMTDGDQTLELHHVQGMDHVEGMIMGYVPSLRVLVEADGFNPAARVGGPVRSRGAPSLLENIQRLGLAVDTIVAVHYPADGRTVPLSELTDFVE